MKALKYNNENYPLTMDTAAHCLNLQPRTVMRRLAAEAGSLRRVRDTLLLHRAEKLLQQDDLTVAEIAAGLGYSQTPNF